MKKLLLIAVAIGLSFPLLAQTNFRSLSFRKRWMLPAKRRS